MSQTFPFLEKIQDRLGYLVIDETGAIIKSDGDLANSEHTAKVVRELLYLERPKAAMKPKNKMVEMTIDYSTHFYTIVRSGKYAFCVKRKRNRPVPPDPAPSPGTSSTLAPVENLPQTPIDQSKTTSAVAAEIAEAAAAGAGANPLRPSQELPPSIQQRSPSRSPSK